MRGTSGNIQIDGQEIFNTVMGFWMVQIYSSGDGAGACDNNQLGCRDRFISSDRSRTHVFGDRTGDQDPV